ncbi:hypothetical protein ABPG72_008896 [Tetrahymena utriculariae]
MKQEDNKISIILNKKVCSFSKNSKQVIKAIIENQINQHKKVEEMIIVVQNDLFIQNQGALEISEAIQDQIHLKSLILIIETYNSISCAGAKSIGQALSKLINLTHLELSIEQKNSIFTNGFIAIARGLSCLVNLTKLHIMLGNKNFVNKEGGVALGEAFKKLGNLRALSIILEDNYICDEGALSIGEGFTYLKEIEQLQFTLLYNNITNLGIKALGQGISQMKMLRILGIKIRSVNKFDDIGLCYFFQDFDFQFLQDLCLFIGTCIEFKQFSCQSLGNSLSKCRQIEKINLIIFSSQINDDGLQYLGKGLTLLNKLQELNIFLYQSQIQSGFFTGFQEGFANLQQLLRLNLQISIKYQPKQNRVMCDLGRSFQFLSNLKSLKLTLNGENFENPDGPFALGFGLKQLKNLENLQLYLDLYDDIKEKCFQQLGEGLKELVNLESLSLVFGRLISFNSSIILHYVQNFTYLKKLYISTGYYYKLTLQDLFDLGQYIGKLQNLRQLIFYIDFQTHGKEGVKQMFKGLQNLKKLNIITNNWRNYRGNQRQICQQAIKKLMHLIFIKV